MSDTNNRSARTFEITAKNFEEGKAQAEAQYGGEGEVSCYLLEKEKKGFLGIGAAPARIRVTVTPKIDVVGDVMRGGAENAKPAKNGGEPKREARSNSKPQKSEAKDNAKQQKSEAKDSAKQQKSEAKDNSKQQKSEAKDSSKQQKSEAKDSSKQQKSEAKENAKQQKSEAKDNSKQQKNDAKQDAKQQKEVQRAAKIAAAESKAAERENIVITQNEMDVALDFVNTLLRNMESDAKAVQASAPEGAVFEGVYPRIEIVGDNTGILIGHHGETMDAIQFLANLCVNRKTDVGGKEFVKIVVDIENYREKREETLRALARRMANKATKNRRNVVLEPMNPYERHIIHAELQGMENIATHSVGSDENRKVIITYEGEDRIEHRSRGRRRNNRGGDRSADGAERQDRAARKSEAPKAPPAPKVSEEESAAIKEAYEAYQEEKAGRERPKRATSIDDILNGDGGLF